MHPVIDVDGEAIVLDLGTGSLALGQALAGIDVATFSALIERRMQRDGVRFAFGRWGERRELYGTEQFAAPNGGERRDVHLGIDVFCAAGTPVHSPLAARVHALANNARELDYGPVVILEHDEGQQAFYTLYGHLADDCLESLAPGDTLGEGEAFASVGAPPVNGNWPPHLHFQLILDLKGLGTEFPGVARHGERGMWFALSPLPSGFFPGMDPALLDGSHGRP